MSSRILSSLGVGKDRRMVDAKNKLVQMLVSSSSSGIPLIEKP
jgi:hypothetical protein